MSGGLLELTSGLSVGMSLSMFVCKRVSRSGSLSANQQSFWDANVGDVILACQPESLSGIC